MIQIISKNYRIYFISLTFKNKKEKVDGCMLIYIREQTFENF